MGTIKVTRCIDCPLSDPVDYSEGNCMGIIEGRDGREIDHDNYMYGPVPEWCPLRDGVLLFSNTDIEIIDP